MNTSPCPDRNNPEFKKMKKHLGDAVYAIWDRNGGNPVSEYSNGEKNPNYDRLVESLGEEEATKLMAQAIVSGHEWSVPPKVEAKSGGVPPKEVKEEGKQPEVKITKVKGKDAGDGTTGISHAALTKRAEELGITSPERGEGISTDESLKIGRKLLKDGVDVDSRVENFKETQMASLDDVALFRAHHEELGREVNKAENDFKVDSKEWNDAVMKEADFANNVMKPIATYWHNMGVEFQGVTEFDTSTKGGLIQAFVAKNKKLPTEKQKAKIDQLVEKSKPFSKAKEKVLDKQLIDIRDKSSKDKKFNEARRSNIKVLTKEEKQSKRDELKAILGRNVEYFASKFAIKSFDEIEKPEIAKDLRKAASLISDLFADAVKNGAKSFEDALNRVFNDLDGDFDKKFISDSFRGKLGENEKQQKERTDIEKTIADLKKQANNLDKLNDLNENGLPEKKDAVKNVNSEENQKILDQIKAKEDELKQPRKSEREKAQKQKVIDDLKQKLSDLEKNGLPKKGETIKKVNSKEKQAILDQIKAKEKELKEKQYIKDITERFVDKKGNKFTSDEGDDIWSYAKEHYLDKDVDYADMLNGVAVDLGLTHEQVRYAISTPKEVRRINDAIYLMRKKRADSKRAAQQWVEEANTKGWIRAIKNIPHAFFASVTIGHATVLGLTHSAAKMFRPDQAKIFWTSYFKMFKYAYGSTAEYQMAKENLMLRKNYALAVRSTLAVNPDAIYDDYNNFGKYLGRVGASFDRAFLAIKIARMDYFDYDYNRLPESIKADPLTAKGIADHTNHATGASTIHIPKWVGTAAFAPHLEYARWARMFVDPAKATWTTLNTYTHWTESTPGEKAVAKIVLKGAGITIASYMTALAINQGLLSLLDSKQKVNMFNPISPEHDWLKFKMFGKTVDLSGGAISVLNLVGGLLYSQRAQDKKLMGRKREDVQKDLIWNYSMGKLSPFAGTVKEYATRHTFMGDVVPPFKDKPTEGKRNLTWGEYYLENKSPIPVSEAVKAVRESLEEQGMSSIQINQWFEGALIFFAAGFTGARVTNDKGESLTENQRKAKEAVVRERNPDPPKTAEQQMEDDQNAMDYQIELDKARAK